MRVGVTFPQTELGGDPGAVRAYAERVEELGYRHILVYDHVVGADPQVHKGWNGPYDVHTTFHEPFVMFGYLAAVTTIARAGHRGDHPAAAPDGAGRQAGRRGGSAQRRTVPARHRRRLERRRVRGARRGLRQPRQEVRRTDRIAAQALDRAVGDLRRRLPPGDGRGYRAAAGAAPDSGVDRGGVGAGLQARRASRRRVVSDDGTGTRAR